MRRSDLTRREFLRNTLTLGAQAALASAGLAALGTGCAPGPSRAPSGVPAVPPLDLAIVTGDSPARNVLAALDALGGMGRFVHAGQRVAIKPNPIGTLPPESGLNTHPEMIAAVVRECMRVGARDVVVFSHDSLRFFEANGTRAAVEGAGGRVAALQTEDQFREIIVPRGRLLQRDKLAQVLLDAEVFINMPVAKHHGQTLFTGAMKNLMGANWNRNYFHETDLERCIGELTSAVRHDLVLLDANNVLKTNGPMGPGEVIHPRQVAASVDPVAIDAWASRAFWPEFGEIRHIRVAYEAGAGEIDLGRLRIGEFSA
jgi:uncharacterized protein (DUF362 family)